MAQHSFLVTIQLLLLPLCALAVETPVPERFLAPRNFNPHPITDVRRPAANYKTLNIPGPADVYAHYLQHREPAYKGQEYLQYGSQEQQRLTEAHYAEHQQRLQEEVARSDQEQYAAAHHFGHAFHSSAPQQFPTQAPAHAHTFATATPAHAHSFPTPAPTHAYQFPTAAPTHAYQFPTAAPTHAYQFPTATPTHAFHQFPTVTSTLAQHLPSATPAHAHLRPTPPVQHYRPQGLLQDYVSSKHQQRVDTVDERIPKKYAFSYAVLDHSSGDDFSHAQKHDGHSTQGQYRVKLPDGRVQVVKYTADKGGYRAKVSYEPAEHLHDDKPEQEYHHNKLVQQQEYQHKLVQQQQEYQQNKLAQQEYHHNNHAAHQQYVENNIAHQYAEQFRSTTYPSVYKEEFRATTYPSVYKEEYRSTTYPSVEQYYPHHNGAVAATYPSHLPRVHVAYNGGSTIEPSQQVFEQHHVYKRDN